jgi:hypothetical protein
MNRRERRASRDEKGLHGLLLLSLVRQALSAVKIQEETNGN